MSTSLTYVDIVFFQVLNYFTFVNYSRLYIYEFYVYSQDVTRIFHTQKYKRNYSSYFNEYIRQYKWRIWESVLMKPEWNFLNILFRQW